jgi:hypothetical protein
MRLTSQLRSWIAVGRAGILATCRVGIPARLDVRQAVVTDRMDFGDRFLENSGVRNWSRLIEIACAYFLQVASTILEDL